jgi:hypothetical protein
MCQKNNTTNWKVIDYELLSEYKFYALKYSLIYSLSIDILCHYLIQVQKKIPVNQ